MSSTPSAASASFAPGRVPAKVVALALSLLLMAASLWELSWPALRVLRGTRTTAEVIGFRETRPGLPDRSRSVDYGTQEDRTREITFFCEVEYMNVQGALAHAELNVASQLRPPYRLGEEVPIAYQSDEPELALAVYDWRTWALGLFLSAAALCFVAMSAVILLTARTPIPLPAGVEPPDL